VKKNTKKYFTNISLFIKLNLLVSTLLFSLFLSLNKVYDFSTIVFSIAAVISTASTLYLIFYIIFMPFSWFQKTLFWILGSLFVVVNITLVVDFFIYRIWKFHINGMVLNILTSPGAKDSIQVGIIPIIISTLLILFFIFIEIYFFKKIYYANYKINNNINRKINIFILPLLLVVILSEKVVYGFANMYGNTKYLEVTRVIPFYQPMSFTRFMENNFGLKGNTSNNKFVKIQKNNPLKYPLNPINTEKIKPVNIFIFASDSVRNSIMSQSVAPNIYKLMQESRVYTNHISGGNATRFGIFSLMYGINSSYWFAFLNAQKGSVLFDVLKQLSYQIEIFSSTSTQWPEFRKTAYYEIQNNIKDEHTGKVYEKDQQTSNEFIKWVDELDTNRPVFSFVFLDAPHSNSYPKEYSHFKPDSYAQLNYLTVSRDDRVNLLNQYKNAIYYNDSLIGKMIQKLKEKNLYNNSIIIFTADHGQEFYEYGNFGHNSSFNSQQVQVPFVLKTPISTYTEITQLTSHLDVVPTLLSYIGVSNPTKDYSTGYNLLSKEYGRKFSHVGSWTENAIYTDKFIYQFSNRPDKIFENKTYYTDSYKEVNTSEKTKRGKYLLELIHQNTLFME